MEALHNRIGALVPGGRQGPPPAPVFLALPQVEMALMLETDPSEILNEIIYATRKGGNIGIGKPPFGLSASEAGRLLEILAFCLEGARAHISARPAVCCLHLCAMPRDAVAAYMVPMLTMLLLVLRAVGVYAGFCNHFNIGAFMEKVPELDLQWRCGTLAPPCVSRSQ